MRLLVIGDFISDVYTFGRAERLCPEAPVPVLIPERIITTPGGAGLVYRQLNELDANVTGKFLSLSTKKRFFAGSHLICRIDIDGEARQPNHLMKDVEQRIAEADAFVISDYGKGGMTPGLAEQILDTGKPCFVDAKNNWSWYCNGHAWFFPNEHEIEFVKPYGKLVRKLGARGCEMGDLKLPATVSEVVDVTGAGDIFMASFVYAWSISLPAEDCLRFANELAGESCRHRGTFVVPRPFAQSVLDRLRVSRESQQQDHGSSLDSISKETLRFAVKSLEGLDIRPKNPADFEPIGFDIPRGDFVQDAKDQVAAASTLPRARTLPQSPSVPTGSSDVPPLQESVQNLGGTTEQMLPRTQSPIESGNQCERTQAQDQDQIRSQS